MHKAFSPNETEMDYNADLFYLQLKLKNTISCNKTLDTSFSGKHQYYLMNNYIKAFL